MKNCRIRKVPKALNMPGNASAVMVLSSPRFCMIWYCGIRNICGGTIITARNSAKMQIAPRKVQPGEGVAGQRAEDHLPGRPRHRHQHGVENRLAERQRLEHLLIVVRSSKLAGRKTGGTWMDSANVLNDVSTSQTNGPIMTHGAQRQHDVRHDIAAVAPCLAIVNPPPLQAELDGREDQDHDHQQEGDGGRIAAVVLDEAPLVEEIDDRLGLRQRRIVLADHEVDQVERLQRVDDGDDATKKIDGVSSGTVMRKNCRIRPAPSSSAAS